MDDEKYFSKPLILDESAESSSSELPAFLSRPEGTAVYHGFALVEETKTDGWCFGAVTAFEETEGCEAGDGFVVAPDGARAGIVWEVGVQEMQEVLSPDEERWGVYAVWFHSNGADTGGPGFQFPACTSRVEKEVRRNQISQERRLTKPCS